MRSFHMATRKKEKTGLTVGNLEYNCQKGNQGKRSKKLDSDSETLGRSLSQCAVQSKDKHLQHVATLYINNFCKD